MSDKFSLSDWLVASDIDGTLNNKLRFLPKRNYEAIHKFADEFGGKFILASGRSIESMRKHFKKLNLDSGICVFTNGAGVYDYSNEKILWLCEMTADLVHTIKTETPKFRGINMQVITPTEVRLVKPGIAAWILAQSSKLPKKVFSNYGALPEDEWCKCIFIGLPFSVDKVEKRFKELSNGDSTNLMRSSVVSFEVVSKGTNKGVAVLETAKLLGIDKEKTAAIGDYFNDYEMLKAVGLSATCGQAPKGMKAVADIVTCHCNKGAVADLIEYIIKKAQGK